MPSMLSSFIPEPHVRELQRVAVVASPARAWETVRHLDVLGSLRAFPQQTSLTQYQLDDFAHRGSDLQLLREEPGHGFVLGAVGRFWQPHLEFQHLAAGDDFADFDVPGFGKIAWGLSIEPRRSGGSWVTLEQRVALTDDSSEAAFDRYWPLISPFSASLRSAVLERIEQALDPIDCDCIALPGDLLLPARYSKTSGVVIEAPVREVWPWLVQLGCQRGGWYAIDAFDNGGQPSAERVHPEWQHLDEGDLIAAVPDGSAHFGVLKLEPHRALVLGSPSLRRRGPLVDEVEPPFRMTWAFVVEPIGDEACWLATRVRADFEPEFDFGVKYGWEALAHLVMQRAQLAHLKARAEQNRCSVPSLGFDESRGSPGPDAPW